VDETEKVSSTICCQDKVDLENQISGIVGTSMDETAARVAS
jgi:hypothetical protein